MSGAANDVGALLPVMNSNPGLAAQTVVQTVMAEQVSHNVVNYSESTSDSLVDVAANQTIVPSADHGVDYTPETNNDILHASRAANEYATQANELTLSMQANTQAELDTKPSNESTADTSAEAGTISEATGFDNHSLEDTRRAHGNHDVAYLEEGPAEDGSLREDSVDVSLNSDTEGSRGDASELKADQKHHVRTNSVKKPTTFSKVSVTKNFLAKSATATPSMGKVSDKPSPAGTPPQPSAAKPRLIAKTVTGLRDVQRAKLGPENAAGPDASKVWNKNRPVAPPPPRQFTDEELKQQYGIHLATRLQTDENGKESKWADIDDDEDDWAPDTVVWMDGTKSTLAPSEGMPLVQKDLKSPSPQPMKPGEKTKPTIAMKRPTELGPTKTILKPGASAAAIQAKQNDSGANTPSDKASLAANNSAAVPSKSPWAVLPPVDKVSPINPPVQQKQPPPFSSQDARAYEPSLPPPPAREIAADTFDRGWREGEGGTRELFNSANGRYEPVPEGGRRGSIKPDSAHRKPSVLQRPLPSTTAPAEPSAAFQTRSTTQVDGPWTRRRGSSVSQGSIPPGRRMSVSKASEISPTPETRSSTVIGHDLRMSPNMARAEMAQPAIFSPQSAWQQQMPPRPESGDAEEEDPVKVQERVMREKRELAKKRREEEEARLEAEKQERLKAKLASLGGAGKSRKEREAEAAAATVVVQTPSSELAPDSVLSASVIASDDSNPQPAKMSAEVAPVLEAQTLPKAPDIVPQEQSTSEDVPLPLPLKEQSAGIPERPISSADQNPREQRNPHLSPRTNARVPFQQTGAAYKQPSTSSYSSPGDRKQQPFGRSPLPNTDAFSPWPTTASHGNVWGTSGIGNGTFESVNGFASIPMSQQSSSLPPPPGMSRQPGSSRISPQSLGSESRSPNLNQQSVAEPPRAFGPPGLDSRPDAWANQSRANGASPAPGLGRQTHLPGPIAPPSRAQQQQPAQQSQRQDALAAWTNAAQKLPYQYKADAEMAENKARELTATVPRDDTFKETFRQTSAEPGKLGAPRRYEKTEYTIHDAQGSRAVQSLSPAPPSSQTLPSGPFPVTSPIPQDPHKAAAENTVRMPDPSLNPAHGGLPSQISPIAPPAPQQSLISTAQSNATFSASVVPQAPQTKEDASPPPPETMSHPVNSGDAQHPLVRLPPEKPKVKLPPASAPAQAPVVQTMLPPRPIQNWGAPGSSRPIVMQEAWQARFNGLFNRTPIQTETPPSPPKTPPKMQGPALAVASSSRAVMDEGLTASGATVSLPLAKKLTSPEGFTIDDSEDVVSKPTIEQMFNEELSFGSLPKISIPQNPIYDAGFDRLERHLQKASMNQKGLPAGVEAQSEPEFNLRDIHPRRRDGYFVHLPALKLLKKFVQHKISGNRKPSGNPQERKPSGKFRGKGRETLPSSSAHGGDSNTESRKSSLQKTQSLAAGPESAPTPSGPAMETPRKGSWPKPPKGRGARGGPPVKAA